MGQSSIKRQRRLVKQKAISDLRFYIDWCKEHITIKEEDGTERLITLLEAVEFIEMTTQQALSQTNSSD